MNKVALEKCKALSKDGRWAEFALNLCISPFNKDLPPNDIILARSISMDGNFKRQIRLGKNLYLK
jgi:hypothetical protein